MTIKKRSSVSVSARVLSLKPIVLYWWYKILIFGDKNEVRELIEIFSSASIKTKIE